MLKTETSSSVSNQERNKSVQLRDDIRKEWTALWAQKFEDKQIAEDVARNDYERLFVETGTVIRASRKFKPLDLEEIIDKNEKLHGLRLTTPKPEEGGFRKFAKDVLSEQPRCGKAGAKRREPPNEKKVRNGPPKKAGRGWLHNE